ncbi:MAG TPA: hypothetical protein VFF19_14015 [Reyranella sp.]|nr:hypothetical protein [Reyranella sp.]
MFTTVGISLSTSSAKLSGALRMGCAAAGCANAKPTDTTAATAADLKTPGKSVIITSDLQRRSGLNGSERPAPRVRVPVYMQPDCGANKEALMLLIVSGFPRVCEIRPAALQDCHNAVGAVFAAGSSGATSWPPAVPPDR